MAQTSTMTYSFALGPTQWPTQRSRAMPTRVPKPDPRNRAPPSLHRDSSRIMLRCMRMRRLAASAFSAPSRLLLEQSYVNVSTSHDSTPYFISHGSTPTRPPSRPTSAPSSGPTSAPPTSSAWSLSAFPSPALLDVVDVDTTRSSLPFLTTRPTTTCRHPPPIPHDSRRTTGDATGDAARTMLRRRERLVDNPRQPSS